MVIATNVNKDSDYMMDTVLDALMQELNSLPTLFSVKEDVKILLLPLMVFTLKIPMLIF